ncbi:uncharacterized protein [Battus philenor]|uniref:uncharacterized protein n=1 Tax=Battus philenor TaxID=42288 RepID=UPI0035D02165
MDLININQIIPAEGSEDLKSLEKKYLYSIENYDDKKRNRTDCNFGHICRICLSKKNLISLCPDMCKNVSDMYLSVTSIKVDLESQPLQICEPCKNDLTLCYNFRIKCLKSDYIFKALIGEINTAKGDDGTSSTTNGELKTEIVGVLKEEAEEPEDAQYLEDSIDSDLCKNNVEDNLLNVLKTEGKIRKRTKSDIPDSTHLNKYKRKKFHFCSLCSKKFLKAKTLKDHIKGEHGAEKRPYSCNQCKKSFCSKHDLDLHATIHNKTDTWSCSECHKYFEDKSRFRRHIQRHMETKRHPCATCGKTFAELYGLRRHERVHTGEVPDKPHACHVCDKRYSSRALLATHAARHTGARPCECAYCGKAFPSLRLLASHRLVHSDRKPYACRYCDKTFRHESTRNTHHRTHTGEKPYVCASCGKTFIQRSNLVRHTRTHTGERPYSCEFCDRKFSSGSTLKNHIRIHTGEKPYFCPVCEKRFARCDMRAHMSQHTGERPHACAVCHKRFARAWRLREHCRQHTGEKPFECANCTDKFATKSQLMKHFKTHLKQKKTTKKQGVFVVRHVDITEPCVLSENVVFRDDDNALTKSDKNINAVENSKTELNIVSKAVDAEDMPLEVMEEVVLEDDSNEKANLVMIESPVNKSQYQTANLCVTTDGVNFINNIKSDGDVNFVTVNAGGVSISSTSRVHSAPVKLYQLDQSLVRIHRSVGHLTIRKITSTTNF